MDIETFIERWEGSGGSEHANFQSFANDLCDVLGVERPKPATEEASADAYRFERPVTMQHTGTQSHGFIDLYRAGHFVMEAKQGVAAKSAQTDASELTKASAAIKQTSATRQGHGKRGTKSYDETLVKARNQADGYARAVAKEDGWPPFLLVVDVGHAIQIFSDFSGQGQGYTQFPDAKRFRVKLDDLRDEKTRERLRLIWTNPKALDPSLVSARVTREVADRLAKLGRSFEGQGHEPEKVARFLMRCLFTMFAEDVALIPENSFTNLLRGMRGKTEYAADMLQGLWQTMDGGGFSQALTTKLKRFNGGLFKDSDALPITEDQLELLIDAAKHDWKEVEPAIFGTLLERALDKRQRHKLGAHYTPRAYVERLVVPTIIEPLREDWKNAQAVAHKHASDGNDKDALEAVHSFLEALCAVRVLDPACGSGNFLYVALELMKRLEGEVTTFLEELGEDQHLLGLTGHTVDPHQFLGIELNPWAAAVAELVLWIGYLQWHFRTFGNAAPSDPVLKDFKNIENRDAVLTWQGTKPHLDEQGQPVTRWDGFTTITHQVTGEEVPDPQARVPVLDYISPAQAQWPQADFIVGNPPFIGASRMREALGDGYADALWAAYPAMPQSADFVMFWWHKAALAVRSGETKRLGLITTNSLRQTFNRRVVEPHLADPKTPLSLRFAIPDHPWVDTELAAAVRIAMTVAEAGSKRGSLKTVVMETAGDTEAEGQTVRFKDARGKLFANLRLGADVGSSLGLLANDGLAYRGMQLIGSGFIVTPDEAKTLGLGKVPGLEAHIRDYRNGRDLTATPRGVMVIDLFGLTEAQVRERFPSVYQHLWDRVKPERDNNNRESYKRNWWIHGEPRKDLRPALVGLSRYIATVETAKYRVFQFLPGETLPDNMLIAIALDDASALAVLSSRIHVVWALARGGDLGPTPRYNKSVCFDPFPFPELREDQRAQLRDLGERLDAHRKARQAEYPKLTLTNIYNVLEKLRAGEPIEGKDRETYDQGLVGILRDLHDQIDAEVAAAYGWPADISDEDILLKLVALNKQRAAEEAQGFIRWLRPDYQNPGGKAAEAKGSQTALAVDKVESKDKAPWPKSLADQIAGVRAALADLGEADAQAVARQFKRGRASTVEPLLDSLYALGQARKLGNGLYAMT